jgi:hypothetical protein
LGACAETADSFYGSYAAAVEAGAVRAGWVPEWLPDSAREIHEVHNIDTNARMLAVELPASATLHLPADCKAIEPSASPSPRFTRSWWPAGVPERAGSFPRHAYWQCKRQFVAKAPTGTRLLVWAEE